ncbi:MAG TPA: M23 family metallopeptidase [Candidatus Moranbacteria bacterium]|jgi:murein DD-endopeptidase MepM/ murein hydrolase activator NlpD|nr:M23 family metallopeptidase [Candidatus Moranbacteria bacterium]HOF42502.1 M23 family metallopeptidase [Candidatus Moranbacteria bacterium]HPX94300.1 M23 family metallopeptidase [Candidatus Moranbacteria bacterium]HQB59578.1 M23 family metallopeptidase [Candidatus Moranbacteria bacterium]
MKKLFIMFSVTIIVFSMIFLLFRFFLQKNDTAFPVFHVAQDAEVKKEENSDFAAPLDRAAERVTKKPFGIFISPGSSPVQPERFAGYHTGADFEVFPEEQDSDVFVRAVCEGRLLSKKSATGYGGVAVQACELENDSITVIYGHLDLGSVNAKIGDNIRKGDVLGKLGRGYSEQTDGERKHLHLGFHKGNLLDILGYVDSQEKLSDWIDSCLYVCK